MKIYAYSTIYIYTDPRPSRQSRDAPVYINGRTTEACGRQKII